MYPTDYIILMFFALLGTIISEGFVAFLFGFRDKTSLIKIALINVITNPVMNYLALLVYNLKIVKVDLVLFLFLEALVVISEWRLLLYAFPKRKDNMFLLSLSMNTVSFIIGLLMFGIPG